MCFIISLFKSDFLSHCLHVYIHLSVSSLSTKQKTTTATTNDSCLPQLLRLPLLQLELLLLLLLGMVAERGNVSMMMMMKHYQMTMMTHDTIVKNDKRLMIPKVIIGNQLQDHQQQQRNGTKYSFY